MNRRTLISIIMVGLMLFGSINVFAAPAAKTFANSAKVSIVVSGSREGTSVIQQANSGDTVYVHVKLVQNPGFGCYGIDVKFDDEYLKPIKQTVDQQIILGDLSKKGILVGNVEYERGIVRAAYANSADVTEEQGTLFTIQFEVVKTSAVDQVTAITLEIDEFLNASYKPVSTITSAGQLTINPTPPSQVSKLQVTGDLEKSVYLFGETLKLDGLEFSAEWTDGTTENIAPSEVIVTGYDSTKVGPQILHFTYNEVTAATTHTVHIIPKLDRLTIDGQIANHIVGEELQGLDGVIFKAYYKGVPAQLVDINAITVVEYDNTKLGSKDITFEYTYTNQDMPQTANATAKVTFIALGDADGNGSITPQDAMLVMRHYTKLHTLTGWQFRAADINKEGQSAEVINSDDAQMILQAYVTTR